MSIFQTTRLRARPVDLDADVPALYEMYSDPVVMTHIGGAAYRHHSVDETRERVGARVAAYAAPGRGMWAVERRDDHELIGLAVIRDINPDDLERVPEARLPGDPPMVEFGYHLRRPHWGQGFGTEMATATAAYAFEAGDLDVLHASVAPDNVASKRILTKLGMTYVTTAVFGIVHDLLRLHRRDWRRG